MLRELRARWLARKGVVQPGKNEATDGAIDECIDSAENRVAKAASTMKPG